MTPISASFRAALSTAALVLTLAAPARAADCAARASAPWPQAGAGFTADAIADGPTCAATAILLVLRRPDGMPLWTFAGQARGMAGFERVAGPAEMTRALAGWLADAARRPTRSDQLPDWTDETQVPRLGDRFFYPQGVDVAHYAEIRRSRRPLFCYMQAMETAACVVLRSNDEIIAIGNVY